MDEKMVVEIASVLKDIRDKLNTSYIPGFRGPVADPGPDWISGRFRGGGPLIDIGAFRGPVMDPQPPMLLDKARLARLKVRYLEVQIAELEKQIDTLRFESSLLKEEYQF